MVEGATKAGAGVQIDEYMVRPGCYHFHVSHAKGGVSRGLDSWPTPKFRDGRMESTALCGAGLSPRSGEGVHERGTFHPLALIPLEDRHLVRGPLLRIA